MYVGRAQYHVLTGIAGFELVIADEIRFSCETLTQSDSRAFLYAGARSLVVSHWDVNDEAASTLMSEMFDTSTKDPGLSHAEALRLAMLKMLNAANSAEEAHPRMWAPFIIVGEASKNDKQVTSWSVI